MQPAMGGMRIDDEIRAKTKAFAEDIVGVLQRAVVDAIEGAVEDGGPLRTARRSGRAGRGSPKATGRVARTSGRRAPGAKRPPAELAKLVDELAAHIQAHPGQRMEGIRAALGLSRAALNLPLHRLLKDGRVRTVGQKRGTEYFPA